ncbi:MAG: N-acetylmuramoyl-L-alanine amidase, partial [Verrucomicrobiota bacterium]
VSIHYNAHRRQGANGIETFYHGEASRPLAGFVQLQLIWKTNRLDRGVKKANFDVIKQNRSPVSVLVEGGFISNPLEHRLIASSAYRQMQAKGIAEGIVRYLYWKGNRQGLVRREKKFQARSVPAATRRRAEPYDPSIWRARRWTDPLGKRLGDQVQGTRT